MTETTAMAVCSRNDFLAIATDSDVALAIQENMQDGDSFSMTDLVRVKTPSSGSLFWTIPEVSGETVEKLIEGVIVFQAKQGILWPSLDSSGDSKPVLVTNDMKHARLNCEESEVPSDMMAELQKHELPGNPGVYDWAKLPYTQFGSGKNGIGKFAKETRLLFILRKNDPWPLVIRVGPGSLKAVTQFIMRLTVPYYRAVVSLSLKKQTSKGGQDYSEIVPVLTAVLNTEDGEVIKERYTNRLKHDFDSGKLQIETEDVME
jgi:hypothetical protein